MRIHNVAALMVVLGTASGAQALDLKGSDTLDPVIKEILANCPAPPGIQPIEIKYIGGGSTVGEDALRSLYQEIAPMSRPLRGQAATATSAATGVCAHPTPSAAEGVVFALDGIVIAANAGSTAGCGGTKTGSDWRTAIRLVFAGDDSVGAAGSAAACSAPARAALVNTWANLLDGACTSGQCSQLWHAFRRGDKSGTTDTFLTLLGLPAVASKPFCNGSEFEDNDPIRRPCQASEEVCSRAGNLGIVLPIAVPENQVLAVAYNTTPCAVGTFKLRAVPTGATRCPNNDVFVFGSCLAPVDAAGTSGCLNTRLNRPSFNLAGDPAADGRVYNVTLRKGTLFTDIVRDPTNAQITGAYYRIHSTKVLPGGAQTCKLDTATKQIGCLAQASPCSIGFAGREASTVVPGVAALRVRGTEPSVDNIRNLIATPTDPNDDYPMARKLYLNTMIGFENMTDIPVRQGTVATCIADPGFADPFITAAGFVTLGIENPYCEDFDETVCGAAVNFNACADNPF